MPFASFLTRLLGLTIITAGILYLLHFFFPVLYAHRTLSWVSLGFYVLLSLAMFQAGDAASRSASKNMFTTVVLVFVFGKMALSLLIVVVYTKEVEPASRYFILPFFLVYLLYTIYETWFLIRLGRQKPADTNA